MQLTSTEIDRYWQAIEMGLRLGIRRHCYVETQVTGRSPLKALPPAAPVDPLDPFGGLDFSLDLRVRSVVEQQEEKDESKEKEKEKPQEKVEHYGVLEGVLKYAGQHDRGSHVLLVGKPGSGKTTALERLLVQQELIAGRLPVLVRLRDLDGKVADPVLAEVRRVLQRWTLNFSPERLETVVDEDLFLLLDGVNELPTVGTGGELRREVQRFRERFPHTPMVFTTRALNVGVDLLGIEKKLEMEPLTADQMEDFTRLHLEHLGPDQGAALLRQLGGRLREFAETPLLLWMLCKLFKDNQGEIPTNLGQVFRKFVELYDTGLKGLDDATRSRQKRFLQALALRMMPQNGNPFGLRLGVSRQEAEDILAEVLQVATNVAITRLDQLLSEHLLQLGNADEVEFKHQLFQEYFAAEGLLAQWTELSDVVLQKHYLNLLDWSEALALVAGLLDSETQALRLVRLGLEVDLYWGARLAGEVWGEFQNETVGLVLDYKVSKLLRVQLLDRTGSKAALPTLYKALDNKDWQVRYAAAEAIGNIGGEAELPTLLKALDDKDSEVRYSAVGAIGNIGGEAELPALLKALDDLDDKDSEVRESAAWAIGNIGGEAELLALVKALDDEDSYVRRQVVKAIGKIGGKAALPALLKALDDKDRQVRRQVVDAISNIGGQAALPALVKALDDKDSSVRRQVVDAIGNIGGESALLTLLKALDYKDWQLRRQVAEAISKIGGEAVLPALVNVLDDEDSVVRYWAVCAIGRIRKPHVLKQLWQYQLQADRLDVLPAIFGIQNTCKIYNYDISQTPLLVPLSEPTAKQTRLQQQLQDYQEEYEAVCQAFRTTIDPTTLVRLKRKLEQLEKAMEQLEQRLENSP